MCTHFCKNYTWGSSILYLRTKIVKIRPLLPICIQPYAFGLTLLYAYVLSIYSTLPSNKFLFRFKFSSLITSRLFSFLLVSEVKFHQTNIIKISIVSIYSFRPVCTFLYAMINGNITACFVQKKEKFCDFPVLKKKFFTERNLVRYYYFINIYVIK